MLLALLLLAPPAPTPQAAPTAPAAEIRTAAPVSAAPRTLADIARERKGKPKPAGTFSAADGAMAAPASTDGGGETTAKRETGSLQERMNKAAERGLWVHENVRYNDQMKASARQEWDATAELCHRTPGCVAIDRDPRIIPTDEYLIEEHRKKMRLSR